MAEAVRAESAKSGGGTGRSVKGKTEKITKKPIQDLIGQDLWELGICEFAEKDVVLIREEAVRRRILKSEVRGCIINHIHSNRDGCNIDLRDGMDYTPSWQRCVRGRTNNLGLN